MLAGGLIDAATDRQVVHRVVTQLGLLEDPWTSGSAIDRVSMCEQLSTLLATLIDSVLKQSQPRIDDFISQQQAAHDQGL